MTKTKFNLKSVIHNQYVLYAVCLVALMNVIQYANSKDFNSMFILLIVGFITSFFSKNMIVILSISIITTYLLCKCNITHNYTEGFDGEEADTKVEEPEKEKEKEKEKVDDETDPELDTSAMKDNLEEFAQLQHGIIEGLEKIEPMLTRAESFIEKFNKNSNELSKLKPKK